MRIRSDSARAARNGRGEFLIGYSNCRTSHTSNMVTPLLLCRFVHIPHLSDTAKARLGKAQDWRWRWRCEVYQCLARLSEVCRGKTLLTDTTFAKEATGLGGGLRWRWVLYLRRCRSARLAHGVGTVHGGGHLCFQSAVLMSRLLSRKSEVSEYISNSTSASRWLVCCCARFLACGYVMDPTLRLPEWQRGLSTIAVATGSWTAESTYRLEFRWYDVGCSRNMLHKK